MRLFFFSFCLWLVDGLLLALPVLNFFGVSDVVPVGAGPNVLYSWVVDEASGTLPLDELVVAPPSPVAGSRTDSLVGAGAVSEIAEAGAGSLMTGSLTVG